MRNEAFSGIGGRGFVRQVGEWVGEIAMSRVVVVEIAQFPFILLPHADEG